MVREASKLIIPMVSIKDTNLAQEKFCIKLQMLSFIGSVLMIVIIMQGSKRVKTCWLNYIIGTVLIKALSRNIFIILLVAL